MLSRLSQLPQALTRHKAGDSRPALFSPSGIGLWRCSGAAAWAKFIALRIPNLGML
jgi:hypothetical protein